MRCACLEGQLALVRLGLENDDLPSTSQPRQLCCDEAGRTLAQDGDAVAEPNGGLDKAVNAVEQLDRGGLFPTDVVVELGKYVWRTDRVFGHHRADVDRRHPVAHLEIFYVLADFDDLTGALVANWRGKRIGRVIKEAFGPQIVRRMLAGDGVGVGEIADASHLHFDQHFVVAKGRHRCVVLNNRQFAEGREKGLLHRLHASSPSWPAKLAWCVSRTWASHRQLSAAGLHRQ